MDELTAEIEKWHSSKTRTDMSKGVKGLDNAVIDQVNHRQIATVIKDLQKQINTSNGTVNSRMDLLEDQIGTVLKTLDKIAVTLNASEDHSRREKNFMDGETE